MAVTVNIRQELAAEAKESGLSLGASVQAILAQQISRPVDVERLRMPEQIRARLDSLAQFSGKIPPLPQTISREWLYNSHD